MGYQKDSMVIFIMVRIAPVTRESILRISVFEFTVRLPTLDKTYFTREKKKGLTQET